MSTLVIPQPAELFGSNDFELQLAGASPQQGEQEEDADTMDTTSSSRSPSPVVADNNDDDDDDENDNATDNALKAGEMTEQMIDDELGLVEEEETDENSPMSEPPVEATASSEGTALTEIPSLKDEHEKIFGGIDNLMNTCYMASALQMMASLESFVQILRERSPRQNSPLREALLDLWDRLGRGETVRPQELKRVIDERSCLFEGNEQQDAHEFLTTLLDLLDEDYKDKEEEKEASSIEAEEDVVVEEKPAAIEETKADSDDAGDMDIDDEEETPSKRMKTCSSYSELNVHQIEQLLHGSMPSSREGMIMPAPQTAMSCRLVGGRMNPTENSSFWSPQRAPTAVEPTLLHDESSRTEQPNSPSQTTSAVAQAGQTQPAAVVPNTETQTKQVRLASPVDECFTTKVRVRLTCDSCKYTRTHDETYQHWSLEMSGDCTVDECLRRFFASERREIKCEKCFGESATQTSQITKLPQMLLLHFKRFVVKVSEDYSSISYEKNSSSVSFDPSISTEDDLQDYAAVDCAITPGTRYQLRSVVNHHGSSVSFGHYTADAKRTVSRDGTTRDWHRFNDSFVSKISEQQAVQESSQSAYLVMYELE